MARLFILLSLLLAIACGTGPACPPNSSESASYLAPSNAWPRASVVLVCWESPTTSSVYDRLAVSDSIANEISSIAAVTFTGWEKCPKGGAPFPGIRIAFADAAPKTLGLGTELRGRPNGITLNATFKAWGAPCAVSAAEHEHCIRTIAVHEFLHALGFAHEQNRADTPFECHDHAQGPAGEEAFGSWDASSVMNYCNDVWNNGGQLSRGDAEALQHLYGAAPGARRFDTQTTTAEPCRSGLAAIP